MQQWLAAAASDYRITGAEMKQMLSRRDDVFSAPMSIGSKYEKDEYQMVQAFNNSVAGGYSREQVQAMVPDGRIAPEVSRYIQASVLVPGARGLVAIDQEAEVALREFAKKDYDDTGGATAVKTGGGALGGAAIGFCFGGPVGAGIGAGIGAVVGGLGGLIWGSSDD